MGMSLTSIDIYRRVSVRADVLKEDLLSTEDGLCIRRPEDTSIEQVLLEKSHRGIRLSIPVSDERFYYDNALNGNSTHVKSLSYGYKDGKAIFDIGFDETCEADLTEISSKELLLTIKPYSELYDKIYLIDPAYGGDETGSVCYGVRECDINLAVAKALAEELSNEKTGVFITRETDITLSEDERMAENAQLLPDCYIKIRCNADSNTRVSSGVEYYTSDADFFDKFNKSELGPVFIEKNRASGSAEEAYIEILCGYLTNKSDAMNLNDAEYVMTLAKSIADALKE